MMLHLFTALKNGEMNGFVTLGLVLYRYTTRQKAAPMQLTISVLLFFYLERGERFLCEASLYFLFFFTHFYMWNLEADKHLILFVFFFSLLAGLSSKPLIKLR